MRQRLRHLPTSLAATAVLLVIALPVAWLLGGGVAVAGTTGGIGLVLVSYVVSSLVVAWGDLVARHLLLPIVLLTYTLKFALFGLVLYRVNEAQWDGLFTLGVAVIVSTVVWTGAQLYYQLHAKIPYVEL